MDTRIARQWALAFHLDVTRLDEGEVHLLKGAFVGETSAEHAEEGVFEYSLPRTAPRGPKRIGASETVGVFGGVEDRGQAMVSAIAERNIGDMVVYLLSKAAPGIMDPGNGVFERGAVVIFGPPLPKVVGRLASLRLPRRIRVCWIYGFPGCDWFNVFPGWSIAMRTGHQPSKLWMEDEIIVEERLQHADNYRVAWLNQYVSYSNVYESPWMTDISGDTTEVPWAGEGVRVPKVLALSMLLALAGRRHLSENAGNEGRILAREQLAGAFLSLEHGKPSEGEIQAGLRKVDELIEKGGLEVLASAERGDGGITLDQLPYLVDNWARISESMRN